jgi:hypothetical protein
MLLNQAQKLASRLQCRALAVQARCTSLDVAASQFARLPSEAETRLRNSHYIMFSDLHVDKCFEPQPERVLAYVRELCKRYDAGCAFLVRRFGCKDDAC